MKRLGLVMLLTGGLVAGVSAQDDWRYRDGYGEPYDQHYARGRGDVLDRAYGDLQWAASSSFYARHQRGHFDHAMREMAKFQDRFSRGRFDKHPLDEVIGEMSHLSRSGELNPQVRETMARDADELRAFRAGGYPGGAYGSYYRR